MNHAPENDRNHEDASIESLAEENRQLKTLVEELKQQVVTDSLTGIYNRAGLELLLGEKINELQRASFRQSPSFSLLCIDLDNFKYINDHHGHSAGDEALRHTAGILGARLREVDILGRYGGDEFVIGLHDSDETAARKVAAELLELIQDTPLESPDGAEVNLSISIGISSYKDQTSWRELFDEADRYMNSVKQSQKGDIASFSDISKK